MNISLSLPLHSEGKRWFLCNKSQHRAFHGSISLKCPALPGEKSIFLAWLSPIENRPQKPLVPYYLHSATFVTDSAAGSALLEARHIINMCFNVFPFGANCGGFFSKHMGIDVYHLRF